MTRSEKPTKGARPPKHDDGGPTAPSAMPFMPGQESSELLLHQPVGDFGDDEDEATVNRGSKPPKPSSSRRLSPTLMKIFQRRREQIGLSIAQLAKLTGIDQEELLRFEGTNGQHRLLYDHAVVVARVLGVKPSEMPGLRSPKDSSDVVREHVVELERELLAGPLITFEGGNGERFGGDVERVVTSPGFAVQLGDGALGESWPAGSLLGFRADPSPQAGDIVLLRHRRSKILGLRRLEPPTYIGLAPWQPPFAVGGEWLTVGRLQVVLPRTG